MALRDGDRYFFSRPNLFSPNQYASIRAMTFARILCDSADDAASLRIPMNVFKLVSNTNPLVSCSDISKIPPLNLNPWI